MSEGNIADREIGVPRDDMVTITRKIEFSASHLYHNPAFSAEENRRVFGKCNNPHGHGHNYTLEVTIAGTPDAKTGMVLDLVELKELMEREVMQRMDHRFLNYEVAELKGMIPTCENIATVIWKLLEPKVRQGKLQRVRLYEAPDLFAIAWATSRRGRIDEGDSYTAIFIFGFAPLHSDAMSEAENQSLYGKCNNPFGHGHNYVVEVTLAGAVDPATGMIANLVDLDAYVQKHVLADFDHRYINEEIPAFKKIVPTTENLCIEIYNRLKGFAGRSWIAYGLRKPAATVLNIQKCINRPNGRWIEMAEPTEELVIPPRRND